MSLESLGATAADRAALARLQDHDLLLARVLDERRDRWRVALDVGEALAEPSGRLLHELSAPSDLPAVGDFLAVRVRAGEGKATIHSVLPRRSVLARKEAGRGSAAQVVAANIDVVLLAVGLDLDWNLRRLERYVAFAWDSGATPVIVLTKSDLCPDVAERTVEAEQVAPGVEVIALSARTEEGVERLRQALRPAHTSALVGSSGVGKSTLLNRLLGEERQAVTSVRGHDHRGQHTTTQRSLFVLPGGALIIDTPGMRELGLLADEASLGAAFADIEALAASCRFNDCVHGTEPGCAVRGAVEAGTLTAERLASFERLEREAAYQRRKTDHRARKAEQQRWASVTRSARRRRQDRGRL